MTTPSDRSATPSVIPWTPNMMAQPVSPTQAPYSQGSVPQPLQPQAVPYSQAPHQPMLPPALQPMPQAAPAFVQQTPQATPMQQQIPPLVPPHGVFQMPPPMIPAQEQFQQFRGHQDQAQHIQGQRPLSAYEQLGSPAPYQEGHEEFQANSPNSHLVDAPASKSLIARILNRVPGLPRLYKVPTDILPNTPNLEMPQSVPVPSKSRFNKSFMVGMATGLIVGAIIMILFRG